MDPTTPAADDANHVLVPETFTSGGIGAFLAALGWALRTESLFPVRGVPGHGPTGSEGARWPVRDAGV